jgi:NAD/NADP transhydrogenase alpha subunit
LRFVTVPSGVVIQHGQSRGEDHGLSQCIFVARESDTAEGRVAGSVETVKKMKALGLDVLVEAGAGLKSRILDADYEAVGARIVGPQEAKSADVVLKVRRPTSAEIATYKSGAIVIATMDPYGNEAAIAEMAKAGLTHLRHGVHAAHHAVRSRWTCCRVRRTSRATRRS